MTENKNIISIQRNTSFTGKRRVGLDTNIPIKLYENPSLFHYEEARIFNYRDTMFTHPICLWEFIKYLKKKGMDEEKAKTEAHNFLQKRNIAKVRCFIPDDEIKRFEDESNKKFKEMVKEYLKAHRPDSIILLSFKRSHINKIISTDESFRECAKFLGIDGSSLPSLDHAVSRELRQIFGSKRRYKKRKSK